MRQFELQTAEYKEDGDLVKGRFLMTSRPTTLREATELFRAMEQVKKQTFIAQGFVLRVVQDDCLYQSAGYVDIYSYARGELGIRDNSTVNRYININKRFSADGYSQLIEDRYMHYKYSALQEIWSMTDEEIEAAGITEATTVAKIREIKKEMREKPEEDEQIPGQTNITDFLENPIATSQKKSDWEAGEIAEQQEDSKEETSKEDEELNLFSEFVSEYYEHYMDADQHIFIIQGDEKGFTTYTEELNYLLCESQCDENIFKIGNLEVKTNFAKMIFVRTLGTYDRWVSRPINGIWMRLQVMKVLGKLPESYKTGCLRKDGFSAYDIVVERVARALIYILAEEGEDTPETIQEIKELIHVVMNKRHLDFLRGDMEYRAEYDRESRGFLISRYKRNTEEIEVQRFMELTLNEVAMSVLNISGKKDKTYTLHQLDEIEKKLVIELMECIEDDPYINAEKIFSSEAEFSDCISEYVGGDPCLGFYLDGITYTYYVLNGNIHIAEVDSETGELKKIVTSIDLYKLYNETKSLWQEANPIATSQYDLSETPENRINTLAGGDSGTEMAKTREKEGVKTTENRINTLADGDSGEDRNDCPEEEVVTAEVLEKKTQILTLQIDISGYNTMAPKEDRFEQTLRCIGEELKKINQSNVKEFNFAVDFIGGYIRALEWIKYKKAEEVKQKKQEEQWQQDPLPDLKNNDQRKEWIRNYQNWPLWIDNEKTKERYYRYNFESGDAFVIKEHYTNRERYNYGTRKSERVDKWEYDRGYILKKDSENSFCDSLASETEMIDYLRKMKRKG